MLVSIITLVTLITVVTAIVLRYGTAHSYMWRSHGQAHEPEDLIIALVAQPSACQCLNTNL